MNIIVPIKVLADDQDIVVAADRSLDDSKAHRIVSTYDLNAIEAAVQLASAHEDSKVVFDTCHIHIIINVGMTRCKMSVHSMQRQHVAFF